MNPATHPPFITIDPDALRTQIIVELSLEHLSEEEQNEIIDSLGEVLLERATFEVMEMIPEDQMEVLDGLADTGTDLDIQNKIREFVPNVEEVIANAVREGIAEHKALVAEEMQKE
jgi:hypothetical protein